MSAAIATGSCACVLGLITVFVASDIVTTGGATGGALVSASGGTSGDSSSPI
jgi:hypothetical protein